MSSGLVAITENKKSGMVNPIPFWPAITVKELRDDYRIYSSIGDDACLKALEFAYIVVTDALDSYALDKERAGIESLEDLPEREQFRQVRLFKVAVYSLAKQKLSESYLDVDLTRKPGSDMRESVGDATPLLNSDYNEAIRRFLGKPASFVALV